MNKISVLTKSYKQIEQFPLFYFNGDVVERDSSGKPTKYLWIPEADYILTDSQHRVPTLDIQSKTKDILFVFGKLLPNQDIDKLKYVTLEVEEFDSNNSDHVNAVILMFLKKSSDSSDKYCCRELLWMLNSYFVHGEIIEGVLNSFGSSVRPSLIERLKWFAPCLSLPKQKVIQDVLSAKGVQYNVYFPPLLKDALYSLYPDYDFTKENRSIFSLIYLAVNSRGYKGKSCQFDVSSDPSNFFLQIRKWLSDPSYVFKDLGTLAKWFKLFTPSTQLKIIKRYFHSVRLGHLQFDSNLIQIFKVNQYDDWGIYFHCAHEASKPVRMVVTLLCDNILTFLNSGQSELQSINGTLDLAYLNCDKNAPSVDFGLKKILPICNGGAMPDRMKFPGFICYHIIYCLNQDSISDAGLKKLFQKFLSYCGHPIKDTDCSNLNLSIETCAKRTGNNLACTNCEFAKVSVTDKFQVKLGTSSEDIEKREILSLFTDVEFRDNIDVEIDTCKMLDCHEIRNRIEVWLNSKFTTVKGTETKFKSGESIVLKSGWQIQTQTTNVNYIIKMLLLPSWITIKPRWNAYVGNGVLLYNGRNVDQRNNDNVNSPDNQRKENGIIVPRIMSTLAEVLPVASSADGSFNVPYDKDILIKIKSKSYTNTEFENSTDFDGNNPPFLISIKPKYDSFCAPKYDNDINEVTGLGYVWCRGKECFKTSLENQKLSCCNSWTEYTMLHMFEIMGYPQVSDTGCGVVASELIRNFIGMVSHASLILKKMRCRECNHLIFPIGSNMNRYNNFECRMPICGERFKRVYISNCHHCKSGLIDSRDSAKCPNGWHICPKCLSCCDDAVYERMASNYIVKGLPVPLGIRSHLGHGHNDKDQYFCPKCGGEVIKIYDDVRNESNVVCNQCGEMYPDAVKWI